MSRVWKITPCVCAGDNVDYTDDGYKGMPIIRCYGGTDRFFDIMCPKCKRGGMFQYRSTYLAIKAWNEMQEHLRDKREIFAPIEEDGAKE